MEAGRRADAAGPAWRRMLVQAPVVNPWPWGPLLRRPPPRCSASPAPGSGSSPNELQLAATSVVSAMLTLSWLAGHRARGRHTTSPRLPGHACRKWGWVMAAAFTAAGSRALLILKGLSDVRTSFLTSGDQRQSKRSYAIGSAWRSPGSPLAFWGVIRCKVAARHPQLGEGQGRPQASAPRRWRPPARTTTVGADRCCSARAWSRPSATAIRRHLYGTCSRTAFPEPVADAAPSAEVARP